MSLDLRCPSPAPFSRLLAKVYDGAVVEIACLDCVRQRRRNGEAVARVLHRWSMSGELVETIVVPVAPPPPDQ